VGQVYGDWGGMGHGGWEQVVEETQTLILTWLANKLHGASNA